MYTLHTFLHVWDIILVNTVFLRNSTPVHRGRRLKNVFCLEFSRVKEDFSSEVVSLNKTKGMFGSWASCCHCLGLCTNNTPPWPQCMVEQNLDHKSGSKAEKWVWAPIPSQSTLKELTTSWKVPHQKGSIAFHRATLGPSLQQWVNKGSSSPISVGKVQVSVSLPVTLSGFKSCYMYRVVGGLKLALQLLLRKSHLDGYAIHL